MTDNTNGINYFKYLDNIYKEYDVEEATEEAIKSFWSTFPIDDTDLKTV